MQRRSSSTYRIAAIAALFTCSLLYMASTNGVAAPQEIRIGASIPLTGLGATSGVYGKWGYSTPINDINKAGGIYLSKYGKKLPVRLILYDDQVDPAKTAANIERLILRDDVQALLGPAGSRAVVAAGTVAEREGVPMVTAQSPIRSFLRGCNQWTYVWSVFFDEQDMARQQFLTMNIVQSNRKVALFTEHAPDGITLGNLWNTYAPEYGYEVVYHAAFPVGASEFGDLIRRAQEKQADIVISVAWLNETITLWRQMRTLGYKPKAAFLEKGGESMEWWRVNGQAAHGTCGVGYWHPALGYPGAQERNRSATQNLTLAMTSFYGVPCRHGHAPLIPPGTLGTDSA